jgi:hypothetical protein
MKKILTIVNVFIFLTSCSKDDNTNKFEITLNPTLQTAGLDQELTVSLTANEEIHAIWVSSNNFATGGYSGQNFGTAKTLYFNFDTLGEKTIAVRCQNANGNTVEKQIKVTITRGNAIKIKSVRVISFYNMNSSYDPEFGDSDPNRLADLQFGFAKSRLNNNLSNSYSTSRWFLSSILENQGNKSWDLTNENLFISHDKGVLFTLADIDNGIAGADLLNGPPDYRLMSFSNFKNTKPTTINYAFPEINLSVDLEVEWPN